MNNNYVKKIYDVINLIKKNHPCINIKYNEEQIDNIVKKNIKKYQLDNKYDFFYLTNLIIKELLEPYDSHTSLTPIIIDDVWFPFQCTIINNYPTITLTSKYFSKYKGYIIKKIDGINIEIILSDMQKHIISNNESWLRRKIELYLSSFFYLKSLPSLRKINNIIIFTLEKNNKTINLKLDINKVKNQYLEGYVPIKNYSYEYLKPNVIIIHFTRCQDKNNKLEKLLNKLNQNKDNITWYILDLRNNSGGNSDIFIPLFEFLKDKKTITLVNYKVFSGGIWAAQYMSDIGSIIVGEEVGDTINNFADKRFFEIDDDFRLDISCKYFYFNNHKFHKIVGKNEFNKFYENNKKRIIQYKLKIDYKINKNKNNYLEIINNIINNKI